MNDIQKPIIDKFPLLHWSNPNTYSPYPKKAYYANICGSHPDNFGNWIMVDELGDIYYNRWDSDCRITLAKAIRLYKKQCVLKVFE